MNDSTSYSSPNVDIGKLQIFALGLLLVLAAMYLAVDAAQGGAPRLIMRLSLLAVIIWFFVGRTAWWVPVPIAVAFGGLFWVGFRIHAYEAALLLALIALVPTLALKWNPIRQNRPPLPWFVFGLAFYIGIHLMFSLYQVRVTENYGMGNVVRTYAISLWAIVFAILFYWYGASRLLKITVILMVAAYIVRILLGLYMYYFPGFIFLPYVNLLFSEFGVLELRTTAVQLFIMLLGIFALLRSGVRSLLLFLGMGLLMVTTTFGGARIALLQILISIFLFALLRRKFVELAVIGVITLMGVWYVNAQPDILYRLPALPSRALSIVVFSERTQVHAEVQGSNEWHHGLFLKGWHNWTRSPFTMAVGNRVYPYDRDFHAAQLTFYERMEISASVSRYEKGLWNILATFGAVGLILYGLTFWSLLKDPLRSLWNNRIPDFAHLIYFVAGVHVLMWGMLCWIWGSFPSYEIMMAVLAKAMYVDAQKTKRSSEPVSKLRPRRVVSPVRLPPLRRALPYT
jgi:hypothetical protein